MCGRECFGANGRKTENLQSTGNWQTHSCMIIYEVTLHSFVYGLHSWMSGTQGIEYIFCLKNCFAEILKLESNHLIHSFKSIMCFHQVPQELPPKKAEFQWAHVFWQLLALSPFSHTFYSFTSWHLCTHINIIKTAVFTTKKGRFW